MQPDPAVAGQHNHTRPVPTVVHPMRTRFVGWRDTVIQHRAERGGRLLHPAVLFLILILTLFVSMILNLGIGGVSIRPAQVIAILADQAGLGMVHEDAKSGLSRIGITISGEYDNRQHAVLLNIRLPRVLLAGLVGTGLAVAGAALQGIFRNPLADPGLIGVSSGAAVGAVGAVVLGFTAFGAASLSVAAFLSGLVTTLIVYFLARSNGRTEVVTLLLTGVALNAIAGAATGYFTFMADDTQLRDITFWSLGSVGGATWTYVSVVAPFVLTGAVLIPRWARALNLLVLGEREARHLGVSTERVRISVIVLAALVTGASVAVAGTIGFVGLVVPHIVRIVSGPDHRVLLPASAIGGATMLMTADLVARTAAAPAELPLGVVTALFGGPFFLWLLHKTRQSHGGWG